MPGRRSNTKIRGASPRKRILLVEDDPALLQTVRDHLARRGFEVEATGDSESAVRAMKRKSPDAVVVDLHLPRESGYEVCETIRNELKLEHVRVVLMGAVSSPEARAFAEEAGADRYMTKPFSLKELDEHIDALLAP